MNPSAARETARAVPRFERVKVTPAYKAVSGAVEQRIVRGDLKPGTLMPTEQNLALQFGVNRSTVREAIRQLEQEGLIARDGSKRLYVSMPGVYDASPRAARSLLLLHQATFEELWQVAMVLEPLAATAAMPVDVLELHDALDRLSAHYSKSMPPGWQSRASRSCGASRCACGPAPWWASSAATAPARPR
jgi:DNA-binding FadR family transcriptional regulator